MNEQFKAILLRIVKELKSRRWKVQKDWELTLRSENNIPLVKNISVSGMLDDKEWNDSIETHINLKLDSDDNITYYPYYTIYAEIFIDGVGSKDIVYSLDAGVAFTERDVNDEAKSKLAASRIDNVIEEHIEQEYEDYISNNADEIRYHKQVGYEADDDFKRGDR